MGFRRILRCFLLLSASLAAIPPAQALFSSSAGLTNSRSAIDSVGERATSASYSNDSSLGQLGVTTQTANGILARSGLMPAYHYPGRISDARVARCPADQATITWTAPGNDGFAPGTRAKGYVVRLSTDPAMSPALSDVFFSVARDHSSAAPSPSTSLATERMHLDGLDPAATYYIGILAVEADGGWGLRSNEAVAHDSLDPVVNNFDGDTGFKSSILAWNQETAPVQCFTAASYKVYRATGPTGPFQLLALSTSTDFTDSSVIVGDTYYYQVTALNGAGAEVTVSKVDGVFVRTKPPMPPARTELSVSTSGVFFGWSQPVSYDFGRYFESTGAFREDELSSVQVWRSTDLVGGWAPLASLSTRTVSVLDASAASGGLYFYKLVASNKTEASSESLIRDTRGKAYAVSQDGKGVVELSQTLAASLGPGDSVRDSLWVTVSSVDVRSQGKTVLAQADVKVHDSAARDVTSSFRFQEPAKVMLSYGQGNGTVPLGGWKRPDQVSVYWQNGSRWDKLYGKTNDAADYITVDTLHAGAYQVRTLERASGFHFNSGDVSSRRITPNGDGLNDAVQFRFDNPADSQVTGKIFDLKGAFVTDMRQTDVDKMVWDGKAGGQVVPGGVYIYQIESEGNVFNGTVVVVR